MVSSAVLVIQSLYHQPCFLSSLSLYPVSTLSPPSSCRRPHQKTLMLQHKVKNKAVITPHTAPHPLWSSSTVCPDPPSLRVQEGLHHDPSLFPEMSRLLSHTKQSSVHFLLYNLHIRLVVFLICDLVNHYQDVFSATDLNGKFVFQCRSYEKSPGSAFSTACCYESGF